jgi:hypothetical protein
MYFKTEYRWFFAGRVPPRTAVNSRRIAGFEAAGRFFRKREKKTKAAGQRA